MAPTWRDIKGGFGDLVETGSQRSDSTCSKALGSVIQFLSVGLRLSFIQTAAKGCLELNVYHNVDRANIGFVITSM